MNKYFVRTYNIGNYRPAKSKKLVWFLALTTSILLSVLIGLNSHVSSVTKTPIIPQTKGISTVAEVPQPVVKTEAGSTNKPAGPTVSQNATFVQESIQPCTSTSIPSPITPQLGGNQTGLIVATPITNFYQIYGNDRNQILDQIYTCTPVIFGNDRFAASTSYSINWRFYTKTHADGLCTLDSVGVGISNTFAYPSWNKGNNTSQQMINTWNNYINHLVEHEEGHANLNKEYAQRILNNLQNYPKSACTDIATLANNQARDTIAILNQANINYDASTDHGSSQGAVL